MKLWLALVIGLPTANATARMRAWRTLKASGAAVLRDGVYLLPHSQDCLETFQAVEHDILAINGTAYLLPVHDPDGERFAPLFDRREDYMQLHEDIERCLSQLTSQTAQASIKHARKLRKAMTSLNKIDFFPGEVRSQVSAKLSELEQSCARALGPDEPQAIQGEMIHRHIVDYQGRTWATRNRPWVDRLASAWFIRRFIDPQAHILWLENANDCPDDVLGFDFDGAEFSHVGNQVTFEVLSASFGLTQPAMMRLGQLVHFLDIGGIQPPEAIGIERMLAGMKATIDNDDQLLAMASISFDALLAGFEQGSETA
ncbi:chromate resistance protein ChrB domain-containing protein [Aeromonas caviae]|uniref:chromate resistance protein ChrB domain-containing protein n=1 Tax=Aeromonas TaxID=642 RepID=UPI00111B5461|nr:MULTISPECIES: chromate resistance protein ChrB domain-containing protein [Aeromonas]MBL0559203.1 chromate resistance protein [Aeromonas caviae]MBL0582510.1 chromate resistance protein [Aeromonas caviae]MDX7755717.1 chromate resistance protein [Aeromonas caviae]MDX7774593.1 chromate resistance protein [Aeromonas caviae]